MLEEYRGAGGDVVVPSSYNGQTITEINTGAFEGNDQIVSVTLGNGIKIISSSAFKDCTALKEVTLGLGTETVYAYAFSGCTGLTKLVVPDKNTRLNSLFDNYALNKTLTIYGYTGSEAELYAHANNAVFIALDDVTPSPTATAAPDIKATSTPTATATAAATSMPEFEVDENGTLTAYNGTDTEVTIPETVDGTIIKAIGSQVFENRSDITAVALPYTVTTVQRKAFCGCTALERINANKLNSVYEYAFDNCIALKELYFDGDVSFGRGALDGCSGMNKLTVLGMKTYINDIPEGISVYGYRGSATEYSALISGLDFYDVKNGEKVKKDFIVNPDEGSLDMYEGTDTDIMIPSEVDGVKITAVGNAFTGSGITSVVIPDSVNTIYYNAFSDCNELKSITVGEGVTSLPDSFDGCEKLSYIRIPPSVTEIENGIFDTCPNVVIYCNEGSAAYEYAKANDIAFVIVGEGVSTPKPTITAEPTAEPTPDAIKYPYDIKINTGGNIGSGYVGIIVKCNEYKENASLIFAEYDDDGKLYRVQMEPLTKGDTYVKRMKYSGKAAKAFVWDVEHMQPYSEMYEKNK